MSTSKWFLSSWAGSFARGWRRLARHRLWRTGPGQRSHGGVYANVMVARRAARRQLRPPSRQRMVAFALTHYVELAGFLRNHLAIRVSESESRSG